MKVEPTALPGVLLLTPPLFSDARGHFFESFNAERFAQATGVTASFVQDNHSRSIRDVLRGIHYQLVQAQGKLVRASAGEVFDVAVDLRRSSRHFGRWTGVHLSAENRQQLWVPPGFGHAYLVLSDFAELQYKTTDYYAPAHERCLRWDDPDLGIEWPLPAQSSAPVLSAKDLLGVLLRQADTYP